MSPDVEWSGGHRNEFTANISWEIFYVTIEAVVIKFIHLLKVIEFKMLNVTVPKLYLIVVQLLSRVWLFASPWLHYTRLPVLHCLLEFAQTHVPWVSDAIQLSHPLSPPSLPALNLSQCQCLFQWIGSFHQVVKVLELQLQHQSFQ